MSYNLFNTHSLTQGQYGIQADNLFWGSLLKNQKMDRPKSPENK